MSTLLDTLLADQRRVEAKHSPDVDQHIANVERLLGRPASKFAQTSCSQCGCDLGPGSSGVSRCADHLTKPEAPEVAAKRALSNAAPELLAELLAAHRLLQIALDCMTPAGQAKFSAASEREGLGTEGATRHHERATVIAAATGVRP